MTNDFQLTYGTMFNPPQELHTRFESALEEKKKDLGQNYGMLIQGEDRFADHTFKIKNPARKDQILATFPIGTDQHASQAVAVAKKAFPAWSRTPWQERVQLLRKTADVIDEHVFEIAAATTLEVGKNRLEALGDVSEAPALIRYACDQMEREDGFVKEMGEDPLEGYQARNLSLLRPYGVWLVISPFNFPTALTGGPVGAALLAGNTVVMKPAAKTSWSVRLLTECFLDAGLPEGAVNFVTGSGSVMGASLVEHPGVDGVTFTGSYDVGMSIHRAFAKRDYVHPVILELGGKNPAIVSRNADVGRAVKGFVRSAFGLQGQKCSANSRVYIEEPLYDEVVGGIIEETERLTIGDPGDRGTFLGPVIAEGPSQDFMAYAEELSQAGTILTGGEVLTHGQYSEGYYCQPTVVADVPYDHHLWEEEMFLPITMVGEVRDLAQAMMLANDVRFGLTAGFYGTREEAEWFFENIQAGVNYVNRPQGSTTGAWPGYQPFGGWKASGSTGANAGGPYYLQRYLREQVRTVIR
jgi:1-pyrroline-5-carboxylate dehydrogenase